MSRLSQLKKILGLNQLRCHVTDQQQTILQSEVASSDQSTEKNPRFNPVGIQMLSRTLHEKLFGETKAGSIETKKKLEIESHLKKHGLFKKKTAVNEYASIPLPPLYGQNIDDHFRTLALQQLKPYESHADGLKDCVLPLRPKTWLLKPGWTKYDSATKKCYPVSFPDEDALVFDVEVLVGAGHRPTMATAVSKTAWLETFSFIAFVVQFFCIPILFL